VLVICSDTPAASGPLLVRPTPIQLPTLAHRVDELPRIIEEYAADALAELGAPRACFTAADAAWTREHAATSLAEIAKGTLRLAALRAAGNMSCAATRLGMAAVSLSRWVRRRSLLPSGAL
jgi:DNA-binding NtrC family response regulator